MPHVSCIIHARSLSLVDDSILQRLQSVFQIEYRITCLIKIVEILSVVCNMFYFIYRDVQSSFLYIILMRLLVY